MVIRPPCFLSVGSGLNRLRWVRHPAGGIGPSCQGNSLVFRAAVDLYSRRQPEPYCASAATAGIIPHATGLAFRQAISARASATAWTAMRFHLSQSRRRMIDRNRDRSLPVGPARSRRWHHRDWTPAQAGPYRFGSDLGGTLKRILRTLIRSAASRAPWGVRHAMLEGCLDGTRASDMFAWVVPRLGIVEIAATGDRGVISSPASDRMVIQEYARTGTFAPTVTRALSEFFATSGGTYLDIGANIGLMTVPFARDPRIRCIAFEPEPVNFGFLQRNVARNAEGCSVELHQLALFHSRSTLSLAIAEGNIGDHRVTIRDAPGRPTVEVSAVPLDDYLDRVRGPVAAKIDTQGAEPFVIAGGRTMLGKAGFVAMEFCPYLMRELGGDPEVAIALVSDFRAVAVIRGGKADAPVYSGSREAVSMLREKLRTAAESDEDYVDILARR